MKIYTFNLNWNEQNNGRTILNSCHSKIVPKTKTNSQIHKKPKTTKKYLNHLFIYFNVLSLFWSFQSIKKCQLFLQKKIINPLDNWLFMSFYFKDVFLYYFILISSFWIFTVLFFFTWVMHNNFSFSFFWQE